ncbi:MAG: hypothetical protein KC900_01460 [Candidatus Omnitrophica bacterium]|nr:hypothetical protein [Candidatus Omnitrophota bacterium]
MAPEKDSEILNITKDLQKRMMYLEKKIDTLIQQTQGRPQGGGRYQPRPYSGDKEKNDRKPFYSGVKKPFKKKSDSRRT